MKIAGPVKPRILDLAGSTSTTSVSFSQWPLDHPIHESAGALVGAPIFIYRSAPAFS